MINKVIITNKSMMVKHYGDEYESSILPVINKLIITDKKNRGIDTKLIYLDQFSEKNLVIHVTDASNDKENKDAVDAICATFSPQYILLLGGQDIIPLQCLKNPMNQLKEVIDNAYKHYPDDTSTIFSDLPYACSAKYSDIIDDYITSVDRSVGRIGSMEKDPKILINALQTAISFKPKLREVYEDYFCCVSKFIPLGISHLLLAEKVIGKTLSKIFNEVKYEISPPNNWENWSKEQVGSLMHVLLCHGYPYYPYFLGLSDNDTLKVSLSEESINNRLTKGTIAVSSACYAAQLFPKTEYYTSWNFLANITSEIPDQNNPHAQRYGMCDTYLKNGAAAFVGSTFWGGDIRIATAYITNILNGLSSGMAFLKARLDFINNNKSLFRHEMRATLASYTLLGDPSLEPVNIKIPVDLKQTETIQKHNELIKYGKKAAESINIDTSNWLNAEKQLLLEKFIVKYLGKSKKTL